MTHGDNSCRATVRGVRQPKTWNSRYATVARMQPSWSWVSLCPAPVPPARRRDACREVTPSLDEADNAAVVAPAASGGVYGVCNRPGLLFFRGPELVVATSTVDADTQRHRGRYMHCARSYLLGETSHEPRVCWVTLR